MHANEPSPPPLHGLRILEFAGIGPAPYAGMLLADLGADIVRIERAGSGFLEVVDAPVNRGRRSLSLDLKDESVVELCLNIAEKADILIEGFRPGVMERLGLGPDEVLARNPRLIYGRMTGWGQTGPLAKTAGHDITYLALTGVLHAMGPADACPVPPLNVVGDMGGGGAFLVIGLLSALFERQVSGRGQVVDAAILDGAVSQLAIVLGLRRGGIWPEARGGNLLDGGAPFYRTYACADGKFVAVGALEPKFFAELLTGLGLEAQALIPVQYERAHWPSLERVFATTFAQRSRDEWAAVFAERDACVAPVLNFDEAAAHPHNAERGTYLGHGSHLDPSPAPRFSRSFVEVPPSAPGEGMQALKDWGVIDNPPPEGHAPH